MSTAGERIESEQSLSRGLILMMAIGAGAAVANLYYSQPLLSDMARSFHTSSFQIGIVSTLTQIGYACGLFLFVPLGDSYERRGLIVRMFIAVILALLAVAFAQNLVWLDIASFLMGMTTVVPQMIVPFAAHLASPERRGKVVGTVMSGLLVGILLARTLSGFVGSHLGWRAMYLIAALLMLLLAVAMRLALPVAKPTARVSYGQLLRSLGTLIAGQPALRDASLLGAMSFAAFSVFWTVLSFFLEASPYHAGAQVAGLFGLVGVVGAMIAPLAGGLTNRFRSDITARVFALITLLSFVVLWLFGRHILGLVVGVILLDLGVQGTQVSNQARIYSLLPEARNRLNTVYMVIYFLGGSLGSSVGSYVWDIWHWTGACVVGALMIVVGVFAFLLVGSRRPIRDQQDDPAV